jgi:hypothetical protein
MTQPSLQKQNDTKKHIELIQREDELHFKNVTEYKYI